MAAPNYEPSTEGERQSLERALEWIHSLASGIGPRRPTGAAEREAAELIASELRSAGVEAELESFRGYSSFAQPFAIVLTLGALPSLISARLRWLRRLLAATASGLLVGEGGLRAPVLSALLSRRRSQNLVASIDPRGPAERTLVLSAHLDTSRSGLMFGPRFVGYLKRWITVQSTSVLAAGPLEWPLGRSSWGRAVLAVVRLIPLAGLALLAQRELAGTEVRGANDNASGCAVVATLAGELAEAPPERTRVVALFTGCEESGTLGSRAFLRSRDTVGWSFINFDSVGGDCSVRYLTREGVLAKFEADATLLAACRRVADRRPELGLRAVADPAGLTYDSTPVHAHGGSAITISAQDGYIPDLHQPTDTYERIAPSAVAATLEVGRELMAAAEEGRLD
ncbi:MAG: M28 family metallopeptidase [Solirubrobacterales bacterium]